MLPHPQRVLECDVAWHEFERVEQDHLFAADDFESGGQSLELPAFTSCAAPTGEPVDVDQVGVVGQVDTVVLLVDGSAEADQGIGCDDQCGPVADPGLQLLRAAAVSE